MTEASRGGGRAVECGSRRWAYVIGVLFFFSSRRRHTRCSRDWSSDVCSSDLESIRSALRAKDFDKAVELSRAALRDSPNDTQLWTLEGIALASKGDSKGALAAFTQALKFSPDNMAALEGAAQIEYQAGNRAAVPPLRRLLPPNPENHVAGSEEHTS